MQKWWNLRRFTFSRTLGMVLGIALSVVVLFLMVWNWEFQWTESKRAPQGQALEGTLHDLSRSIRPAIVEVEVIKDPTRSWPGKLGDETLLRKLSEFSPELPYFAPLGLLFHRREGLGFVTDPDGIVLTDASEVRDASLVRVKLHDHRRAPARVLGVDEHSGIAVLKLNLSHLPTVEFARAPDISPGAAVIIPSKFGDDDGRYRVGSVVARNLYAPDLSDEVTLETDLAIESNEYGAPLLDAKGKVIGILSSLTGSSDGALAVPIDIVQRVERQLLERGHACRAELGVTVGRLSKRLANDVGLSDPAGLYVYVVRPGGAAARAGIKRQDVIVALDDQDVFRRTDLAARLQGAEPGQALRIKVFREGELREFDATLDLAVPDQLGECNSRSQTDPELSSMGKPKVPSKSAQESDDA